MNLTEIIGVSSGGLLLVILSLIKIPKIEINIWGLLARGLGRALNKEMFDKVDGLSDKITQVQNTLDQHLKDEEEDKAREARKRILNFNDEDMRGLYHSKEHFDEILDDIDAYEKYCNAHPEFPNNKAMLIMENIKELYSLKSKEASF